MQGLRAARWQEYYSAIRGFPRSNGTIGRGGRESSEETLSSSFYVAPRWPVLAIGLSWYEPRSRPSGRVWEYGPRAATREASSCQLASIATLGSGRKSVTKIAILGWGSLLWDKANNRFDEQHEDWRFDGPILKLEFSRKSASRLNALTLVIDAVHGQECQVAYAMSKRAGLENAIADLCAREKTPEKYIGFAFADGSRRQGRDARSIDLVVPWAKNRSIDAVLWTDLPGSFDGVPKHEFLNAAVNHVQQLPPEGKAMAAEYVWRAPDSVVTSLRKALQSEPWFRKS